jgi:hypothetical protein
MSDWNRFVWISVVIATLLLGVGVAWLWRQPKITRPASYATELPAKPYTVEHLPVLRTKLEALNAEAAMLRKTSPRLPSKDAEKRMNQVWEEIFYTPEFYPAFLKIRTMESAKVVQHRPELADHLRIVTEFQDGRYAIANDPTVMDKAAAIAALEKRLGPGLKNPEYSRHKNLFLTARREITGDPELEQADQLYQQFRRGELVKRLPELAGYFRQSEAHYDAYMAVLAQANTVSSEIKALEIKSDLRAERAR